MQGQGTEKHRIPVINGPCGISVYFEHYSFFSFFPPIFPFTVFLLSFLASFFSSSSSSSLSLPSPSLLSISLFAFGGRGLIFILNNFQ
jgi:hypothetical protein